MTRSPEWGSRWRLVWPKTSAPRVLPDENDVLHLPEEEAHHPLPGRGHPAVHHHDEGRRIGDGGGVGDGQGRPVRLLVTRFDHLGLPDVGVDLRLEPSGLLVGVVLQHLQEEVGAACHRGHAHQFGERLLERGPAAGEARHPLAGPAGVAAPVTPDVQDDVRLPPVAVRRLQERLQRPAPVVGEAAGPHHRDASDPLLAEPLLPVEGLAAKPDPDDTLPALVGGLDLQGLRLGRSKHAQPVDRLARGVQRWKEEGTRVQAIDRRDRPLPAVGVELEAVTGLADLEARVVPEVLVAAEGAPFQVEVAVLDEVQPVADPPGERPARQPVTVLDLLEDRLARRLEVAPLTEVAVTAPAVVQQPEEPFHILGRLLPGDQPGAARPRLNVERLEGQLLGGGRGLHPGHVGAQLVGGGPRPIGAHAGSGPLGENHCAAGSLRPGRLPRDEEAGAENGRRDECRPGRPGTRSLSRPAPHRLPRQRRPRGRPGHPQAPPTASRGPRPGRGARGRCAVPPSPPGAPPGHR